MKSIKSIVLCATSLLLVNTAAGENISVQPGADDLRAERLQAAPDVPLANTNRETVSFGTAVDQNQQLAKQQAYVATSREYRVSVSATQLQQGVTIRTTGEGAVVALSPLSVEKGAGLSPLDLSIKTPGGTVLRGSDGMDQLVDQAAIQASGVPFSNGMVGFRLNRALGSGEFVLQAGKSVAARHYQLHVLDVQGSAELSLRAPEQTLVGQMFEANGNFSDVGTATLKSARAFVLSPEGERFDADVSVDGDAYSVNTRATAASSFDRGLWELHVSAFDARGIQRDVKTAFAVAYATARLDGSIHRADWSFDLGVQAVSAGRYEASAILYGTSKAGGAVPVATAATAQWLERGASAINLTFDAGLVDKAGATAPFTLRAVTLKDQSRMTVLEHVSSTTAF